MFLFPPIHQTEAEHDGGRGKGQYPPVENSARACGRGGAPHATPTPPAPRGQAPADGAAAATKRTRDETVPIRKTKKNTPACSSKGCRWTRPIGAARHALPPQAARAQRRVDGCLCLTFSGHIAQNRGKKRE